MCIPFITIPLLMLCYTKNSKRSTIFKGVPYCHPRTGTVGRGHLPFFFSKSHRFACEAAKSRLAKRKGGLSVISTNGFLLIEHRIKTPLRRFNFLVEVAGIEPASEECTTFGTTCLASTYIFICLRFAGNLK